MTSSNSPLYLVWDYILPSMSCLFLVGLLALFHFFSRPKPKNRSNTTPIQPISYPTWEYVLQYMSVDTRLSLSQRCPAIRNLDHRVPLKIGDLRVSQSHIDVNFFEVVRASLDGHDPSKVSCCSYKLGIIKIIPGNTPRNIQLANEKGGHAMDIDRYGESEEGNQRIADARIAQLEKEIRQQEDRVEDQRPLANTEMGKRFLWALEKKIVDLRAEIEEVRRNGYIPPFCTYYLQLISHTKAGRKVERFEYTKPIGLATKYLFEKLFPPQSLILVDTLEKRRIDVSFARPPHRLQFSGFDANTPLNGLESELCFNNVGTVGPLIQKILETDFESEKVITVRLAKNERTTVMNDIKDLPGAKLRVTSGHVTFPTKKQFKITFYLEDNGRTLHVKVEQK